MGYMGSYFYFVVGLKCIYLKIWKMIRLGTRRSFVFYFSEYSAKKLNTATAIRLSFLG